MNSPPQLRPIIQMLRQPALGWPTVLLGGAALLASPALLAAGPPVSFAAPVSYATGIGPWWASVGDFNGDGKMDLVTANESSNTVSVMLGNGDGTFGSQNAFATGSIPISVAVGDLDHDGDADLVTSNFGSNTASVLLGNGDGSFAAPVSYATGSRPYSARLAQLTDLDLDGNLDLVTANRDSDSVSVLRGNGDGTFGAQTAFAVGSFPTMVVAGDVNKDGHLDLVTGNYSSCNATLLLGNGHGGFASGVALNTGGACVWSALTIGDLDQDGDLDLVAGNRNSNTAGVLLGNGDGSFAAPVTYATGEGPFSATLGDLNNDGKLDLLTTNYSPSTASVLLGNGDGSFAAKTDISGFSLPLVPVMADLNADGKLDLAVPNNTGNNVSVLLNTTGLPWLSFAGDTLTVHPPAVETCPTLSEYVIHYNTQTRLAATPPLGWGIWARGWPTTTLTLPLTSTKTAAGCKTLGGASATCFRPLAIGEQDPGETYVYRIYAKCGGAWTLPSPQLTVTRPLP